FTIALNNSSSPHPTASLRQLTMSNGASKSKRFLRWFEIVVIAAMQVLLIMLIVVATIALYGLFFEGVRSNLGEIGSAEDLHGLLQKGFGGVLIVLLGLELMETLKAYFTEHHIRVE